MVLGAYDDPNYTLKREVVVPQAAGAAGTNKFALYASAVLLRARAVVKVAGTSANTGAYIDVLVGTTTAGRLLTGSSTAGSVVDVSLAKTVCPAGTLVSLVNGTDASASANVSIEYSDQP
jgi:hypothetical protein